MSWPASDPGRPGVLRSAIGSVATSGSMGTSRVSVTLSRGWAPQIHQLRRHPDEGGDGQARAAAQATVADGLLTTYQAEQLLAGRSRKLHLSPENT